MTLHVASRASFGSVDSAVPKMVPLTSPETIAVGNLLVLTAVGTGDRTLSVSDPAGNAWAVLHTGPLDSGTNRVHVAYTTVTSGYSSGAQLTVNMTNTSHMAIKVDEFLPAVQLDKSSAARSAEATIPFSSGQTAPTDAAALLLVGVTSYHASGGTVTPDGAGWAPLGQQSSSSTVRTIAPFWSEVNDGPGQYVFSGEFASTRHWSAMVLAFEVAPAFDPPSGLTVTQEGVGLRSSWSSSASEFVLERERWTGGGTPP